MMSVILTLAAGFGFGFALQKAGLGHYDRIVNQFRGKDFTMMKFMLSAIVTGLIAVSLLRRFGLLELTAIPETRLWGNLVGGLLLGAGMGLAGACPGTLLAGGGQGNLDSLIPGLLGFLAGGVLFGLTYDSRPVSALFFRAAPGRIRLPDVTPLGDWFWVLLLSLAAAAFYLTLRRREG
ncbi:MAG: YeeE/YedE family protein [Gracilibacteraceae bacterium]|jgi:uncharacterized membrane protein YedE/YeeE|nr:YeeE/YedE family protein [Gracilibacteraceae bacterium]